MKPEMRHKLAQLPFEEKLRKVGELIRLSRKIKAQRVREDAYASPASDFRHLRRKQSSDL
jgi:hypothetical protein